MIPSAASRRHHPQRMKRSGREMLDAHAHDDAIACRAARKGHALDPWRHVHDGLRGLLSRGATRPRGRGRRVLDGRAPGHRRRVPPVREGDRPRHARGAPPRPGRLPGRRSGRCSCPARSCSTGRAAPVDLDDYRNWWSYVPGRQLAAPRGPGQRHSTAATGIPVTHVAYEDVEAYAAWAGKALPTEAEWEYAARGGLEGKIFTWGDEFAPKGRMMANTWQGEFPWQNLLEDGYEGTSPVKSFPPNGYGLYDMAGNVWEWTRDFFTPAHPDDAATPAAVRRRTRGSRRPTGASTSANRASTFPRRVVKGGSHLCAPNYCLRYRPAARQAQTIDTSMGHLGFRCIVRPT